LKHDLMVWRLPAAAADASGDPTLVAEARLPFPQAISTSCSADGRVIATGRRSLRTLLFEGHITAADEASPMPRPSVVRC
jgi:hypothetical protein